MISQFQFWRLAFPAHWSNFDVFWVWKTISRHSIPYWQNSMHWGLTPTGSLPGHIVTIFCIGETGSNWSPLCRSWSMPWQTSIHPNLELAAKQQANGYENANQTSIFTREYPEYSVACTPNRQDAVLPSMERISFLAAWTLIHLNCAAGPEITISAALRSPSPDPSLEASACLIAFSPIFPASSPTRPCATP